MSAMKVCLLLLVVPALGSVSVSNLVSVSNGELVASMNPIRRVVTLLQNMEKKVHAEGEAEEKLYDKFMCYCSSGASTLSASIDAANTKVPQVASSIEEAEGQKVQLQQELKDHQASRDDAKNAMAEADSIRAKEAATFASEKAEADSNIASLKGAIAAIEKGMTGSFLQTTVAKQLQRLTVSDADLSDFDRNLVVSFLSGSSSEQYTPQSGQITGILKEMQDTMEKDLSDLVATENTAIANHEALMAAKTKEVEAHTHAIEVKTVRVGDLGVEIASMKNDLSDTEAALLEDQKFLADLDSNCKTKKEEWAGIVEMRNQELLAIADTIKILNDDDALELFKKTLASASALVEVTTNRALMKKKALAFVKDAQASLRHRRKGDKATLDLIALALAGKKVNFDKVLKMIDDMVGVLSKEQEDDDHKKEYCNGQIDMTEDKKKEHAQTLSDLTTSIEEMNDKIATTKAELEALSDGIHALDKDVAEATEQRKEENEDFTALMAGDTTAKDLLGVAKNRLNKFYNPTLYKAPPKRELSEEDQLVLNMGGTLAPTAAPGGIAGTGVGLFVQINAHKNKQIVAPAPPPQAPSAYKAKGEESGGVVAMIDMLIADLDKEMTEAQVMEKDGQKEYENFMGDSASKRATDSKSITDKESLKADLEMGLEQAHSDSTMKTKELMATEEYLSNLHGECDWLLSTFDLRKEARAGEVDSLKKAKAVLAGADFSFVQKTAALRGSAK